MGVLGGWHRLCMREYQCATGTDHVYMVGGLHSEPGAVKKRRRVSCTSHIITTRTMVLVRDSPIAYAVRNHEYGHRIKADDGASSSTYPYEAAGSVGFITLSKPCTCTHPLTCSNPPTFVATTGHVQHVVYVAGSPARGSRDRLA